MLLVGKGADNDYNSRTMSPRSRTVPDPTFGKDELRSVFFDVTSPRIAPTCRHCFTMGRHSYCRRRKPRRWAPESKRTNPAQRRARGVGGAWSGRDVGLGGAEGAERAERGGSGKVYTSGNPRDSPRRGRSGRSPSGFLSLEVGSVVPAWRLFIFGNTR